MIPFFMDQQIISTDDQQIISTIGQGLFMKLIILRSKNDDPIHETYNTRFPGHPIFIYKYNYLRPPTPKKLTL